jgi:hypothetical protein
LKMANMYMTGYEGKVRTLTELKQWSHWIALDPELQRRTLAILDASIAAGRPLGIGSVARTYESQRNLFLTRHEVVMFGGCCKWEGKSYKLRSGYAHAAAPGRSYHEPSTPDGKSLAIDFTGNLKFLAENAAAYGLVEFTNVNNEPWHGQPSDVPKGRVQYVPAIHHPLKKIVLPSKPATAPLKVYAPVPTLKQGAKNNLAQVRALQNSCNFWGWRDALGRTLIVDGDYGAKTAQAVMVMQKAFGRVQDGVYGLRTAESFQQFLDGFTG